jgi:prohibitin 2
MKKWLALYKVELVLFLLVTMLTFVYLAPSIFIPIHSGESGVVWHRFGNGTVTGPKGGGVFSARLGFNDAGNSVELDAEGNSGTPYPYSEGMAVIFPWDKMYIYDIRLQEHHVQYDVLAKDGLTMRVSISIRWKPIEADLGKLHQDVGPEYLDTLIIPIVGAFAREEIGQFDAEDLYAEQRLLIQNNILTNVQQRMVHEFYPASQRESLIRIENILIREIVLPEKVSEAIQDKVEQMHLADAYVYRLEREVQEAERKAIEARGIRRFQEEINGSITNEFLRWKGIDATLQLAKSNNAKVVVIGAGDEGLPIILGGLDSPAQTSGVAIERDPEPESESESELDISKEVDSESDAELDQEFDSRARP